MSHLNDTLYPTINMYLQSDDADIKESDSICTWYLNETIIVPVGTRALLSLTEFECPYSFYNIDNTNNELVIETTTNTVTITLPPSNYDVESVVDAFNLALAAEESTLGTLIVVTFSFSSNKFTFTSDTLDFTITDATTIGFELGINNLPLSSTSLTLVTPDVCNFAGSPYLQINTDLGIRNIDNKGRAFGILSRIPIRTEPTQYIFHQATENQYFMLDDRKIESIKISLTDFKGRSLQLNGAIFSLTIALAFQYQRIPQNINMFKLSDAYNEMFVEKSKQEEK